MDGSGPGMLYVTMQPREGLSPDQFHEWYNNEHGPTRLRLPHIFANGLRYRAADGETPHFLAVYDVTSMRHLDTPTYTDLRANRSPREAATIGQVAVDRKFLDLVATQQSPLFAPIEQLTDAEAQGLVLVSVEVSLKPGVEGAEEAVVQWYREEHLPMLSKIPGWLRSRVFRTPSVIEGGSSGAVKIVTLHEYAKENGLEGPEHKAAMRTPRRDDVFAKYIAHKARRTYELFYVFGPAPRDLQSLSRLPPSAAFSTADGKISTVPGGEKDDDAAINAFVTTPTPPDSDSSGQTILPYRLEGNPSPTAPTIAFCNSLLTSLHMWDPLVAILKSSRPDLRILRYDTRGRHDDNINNVPVPATLDMLADDLATLLAALRIPRLHALVGVSMGGATTLKFALKYPGLLDRFVACDFNVASSDANTAAWKERIAVAEGDDDDSLEGGGSGSGMRKLARLTVERWFHPHTMAQKKDVAEWMTDMVAANSVQGFRYSCQALWNYNLRDEMKGCTVPGLFVVGEGDGKGALVKAMDGFKGLLGPHGGELKIVPLAGHLPMSESPREFWDAIAGFV
ncbi:Alpha/Beta hydrolase protein [Chaetomium strumarium]|uniref:Alpha/Beta hydrolase protein n=1 Tax=Chaetomium strumarium TaxID=1170767 RepID=A0AAJ0LZZ4_9PEZI|nr:Alpha/Beta hydrolase protein [Chaetomium strumarium]